MRVFSSEREDEISSRGGGNFDIKGEDLVDGSVG